MVEATVALRNGEVMTLYAESFEELFETIDARSLDIVQVVGKTIKPSDIRQGKERLSNGNLV